MVFSEKKLVDRANLELARLWLRLRRKPRWLQVHPALPARV
jgi:hypothetical protein